MIGNCTGKYITKKEKEKGVEKSEVNCEYLGGGKKSFFVSFISLPWNRSLSPPWLVAVCFVCQKGRSVCMSRLFFSSPFFSVTLRVLSTQREKILEVLFLYLNKKFPKIEQSIKEPLFIPCASHTSRSRLLAVRYLGKDTALNNIPHRDESGCIGNKHLGEDAYKDAQ